MGNCQVKDIDNGGKKDVIYADRDTDKIAWPKNLGSFSNISSRAIA